MIGRYALFLAVVLGVLFTAIARKESSPGAWPDRKGPRELKFSHNFHLNDVGAECINCHPAGQTSETAEDNLRSTHDECISCHETQLNEDCGYCHVDPDNIQAIVPPVRTIVFSHRQHAGQKELDCATCHTGLDKVDYSGPANMPPMETCSTCHNNLQVTNACEACHVSFAGLIPADHLVSTFRKDHKRLSRVGSLEAGCATCHGQNFCADCHSASDLLQFGTGGGLMADPSARSSPSNSPDKMKLTMVHDLNYRFIHGIDAKSRSADCYSCHSRETFCAECHAAGDNITTTIGFKPAWHLGGGFVTLGRGSGGGRHADFARRDIESCVSCHDVQGNDPTCIICHVDADGIRGTDPRTHPVGFQQGEMGPWHTSPAETCYSCHTDFNARPGGVRGRGFCGYCHSS